MTESQFLESMIFFIVWIALTFIVCIPICMRIINRTNHEYLAFLVYPIWIIISALALDIYLI